MSVNIENTSQTVKFLDSIVILGETQRGVFTLVNQPRGRIRIEGRLIVSECVSNHIQLGSAKRCFHSNSMGFLLAGLSMQHVGTKRYGTPLHQLDRLLLDPGADLEEGMMRLK